MTYARWPLSRRASALARPWKLAGWAWPSLGAIMTPAIAINYLHQRKSLKLFLIDASHFVVGMAAVGLVFVLLD